MTHQEQQLKKKTQHSNNRALESKLDEEDLVESREHTRNILNNPPVEKFSSKVKQKLQHADAHKGEMQKAKKASKQRLYSKGNVTS